MITKMSRPSTGPLLWVGDREKLDSQGDQMRGRRTTDPYRGLNQERPFLTHQISRHTPEGSDHDERESPSLGHTMGDKRRPRPSESSHSEKPLKVYSTPLQARGLLSGTNTRVPKEEELMTINIDSSKKSRARLRLQSPPGHAMGNKRKPRPSESSHLEKHPKEYSTPS